MMPFDRVAELLPGFKLTGKRRGKARCPAHKDRTPSLSVCEFDAGVLGLHCFGGCSVHSVVSALGLAMEDLFPPDDARRPARPGEEPAGRRGERRPFTARQVLDALVLELHVAWVLLTDIANGRQLDAAARRRAGVARERCQALIEELRSAR